MLGWLDEEIPALGGKTPREAAKDPAMRQEVERMIRTFPDATGPTGTVKAPRAAMLGSSGAEIGMSVLRGELACEGFEEVLLVGGRLAADAPCDTPLLSFEKPIEMEREYLRPIQGSGRVFGHHSLAPIFLTKVPGEPSRPMTRPELRLMLAVLKTLVAAVVSDQMHQLPWDEKRQTVEFALEGKGKKATVIRSTRTWPPPRPEEVREVRRPTLSQRWHDVTSSAPRTGAKWDLMLVPSPPVEGDPRPAELLLVQDTETGSIYEPGVVVEGDPDELAEALAYLFEAGPRHGEGSPGLPAKIAFVNPRPMRQMRAALEDLSIEVTVDPDKSNLLARLAQISAVLEEANLSEDHLGGCCE
ncbi:hypothetical protein Poly30_10730 [Planctomycetes bacterium Poly30]|uniref:Uncharacterized protein n=1 Tax=Saltatorellus ferox TaxID=2528018 RepID=A0A518ENB3_9BACT|nr:hypothetical protein Poly30_10730 [Planctomycetes bacterium Poly30]